MAELTLVEEIQLLINLGVDPTVAATTVNNERTRRSPPAVQPGNYLHPVNFIVLFTSHILHICILFAFDEFHLMGLIFLMTF